MSVTIDGLATALLGHLFGALVLVLVLPLLNINMFVIKVLKTTRESERT